MKIEEKKRTVIRVVFVSSESHHDATFHSSIIERNCSNLEMIHYWTDSPTSQYRNKTIFKVIYHEEYFNCKASWNYTEAGHGKGPCDPIGGTAKHKADPAVKNGKFVIQDAVDFYD